MIKPPRHRRCAGRTSRAPAPLRRAVMAPAPLRPPRQRWGCQRFWPRRQTPPLPTPREAGEQSPRSAPLAPAWRRRPPRPPPPPFPPSSRGRPRNCGRPGPPAEPAKGACSTEQRQRTAGAADGRVRAGRRQREAAATESDRSAGRRQREEAEAAGGGSGGRQQQRAAGAGIGGSGDRRQRGAAAAGGGSGGRQQLRTIAVVDHPYQSTCVRCYPPLEKKGTYRSGESLYLLTGPFLTLFLPYCMHPDASVSLAVDLALIG